MSQARSVSKPICCALTIVHVQTESWEFPPACKMKESNHLKTHKTQVSVVGPCKKTHSPLHGRYSHCAQLFGSVRVCMCGMRVCEECVLTLVMSTVFGPSREICSKLNFKQTWVYLMRCWSEVRVWSHKVKKKGSQGSTSCPNATDTWRYFILGIGCSWAAHVPSRCNKIRAVTGQKCDTVGNKHHWEGRMHTFVIDWCLTSCRKRKTHIPASSYARCIPEYSCCCTDCNTSGYVTGLRGLTDSSFVLMLPCWFILSLHPIVLESIFTGS